MRVIGVFCAISYEEDETSGMCVPLSQGKSSRANVKVAE